jgi:hypothetical protein
MLCKKNVIAWKTRSREESGWLAAGWQSVIPLGLHRTAAITNRRQDSIPSHDLLTRIT